MALEASSFPEAEDHLRTLTLLSLLSRVLTAGLIISSTCLLTPFDNSSRLVLSDATPPWISSLLRWDAFHFLLVAQQGHAYEHTWAFFPALPFLMRVSGQILSRLPARLAPSDAAAPLLGGALLAALVDPTRTLYRLSLYHLRSPSAAFLAAALSLLSSSPATLRFAPYTEPFFTYCSFKGMLACARTKWAAASMWFALASAFRSNGVLLTGFVLWGMLVEPYLYGPRNALTPRRVLYCTALVTLPLVPFVHHNYTGYVRFCTDLELDQGRPGWCDDGVLPSIYGHVQARYWNVGFMRYWTLSNVPNFVLALPVLANVYAFGAVYLVRVVPDVLARLVGRRIGGGKGRGKGRESTSGAQTGSGSLFVVPSLLPHVLHALVLALVLTFNAHVQIALRVLPSLPVVYWAAAWLLIERPAWGKAWVTWSVIWGAVSCVLWAVFLPPA